MDQYNSWTRQSPLVLDKVLDQQSEICWCIGYIRQFTGLCRIQGLLNTKVSLSIQYLLNGVDKIHKLKNGGLRDLESFIPAFRRDGACYESLCPLTFETYTTNEPFEVEVTKFRAEKVTVHHSSSYNFGAFCQKLIDCLKLSPVAVSMPNYPSLSNINGNVIYLPTAEEILEVHLISNHVMLMSGFGVENGAPFYELQDSWGLERGDDGFIRVAASPSTINRFIEINNPYFTIEKPNRTIPKFTGNLGKVHPFDTHLYRKAIQTRKAHASMLFNQRLIDDKDKVSILGGLDAIGKQIEERSLSIYGEDVHLNIGSALSVQIGECAKKLHLAQNRNDMVATDFRLWVRDAINEIIEKINILQMSLLQLALTNVVLIVPGCVYLQLAEPILLQHVLLCYVEQLQRDKDRYADCKKRLNSCPLGACALGGSSLPIDRFTTAKLLSFNEPMRNSIDAVTARDFLLEFLFANSNTSINLSRFGEESEYWENSDLIELVRRKSGGVIANLVDVLSLCKGLSLSRNHYFHEEKEAMYDSTMRVVTMLDASLKFAENVTFNKVRIESCLTDRQLDSSTLVDYLVWKGMSVEISVYLVKKLVKLCISRGCDLWELKIEEMKSLSDVFDEDVFGILGVEKSVNKFISYGSTRPEYVSNELNQWIEKLSITVPHAVAETNGASSGSGQKVDAGPAHSIFVGDLAPDVTDHLLQETFGVHYSSVRGAKVVTDPSTAEESERNRAMSEMSGLYCSTRPMHISATTPKKNIGLQQQYVTKAVYPVPVPSAVAAPVPSYVAQPGQVLPPENDVTCTTVSIANLDPNVTEEELKKAFSHLGEIIYVKIPAMKGYGYVQFKARPPAEEAIQKMQGHVIGQQAVGIFWSKNPGQDGYVTQADPSQWSGYYGYGQGYDAYAYGTTQDPSLYAYGGYGYPQYPHQGEGTQEITNSAAGGVAGAEQELYDPLATPDVDKLNAAYPSVHASGI